MLLMLAAAIVSQAHASGRHVDVFGDLEAARKAAEEADAAGERFRALFGAAPVRGAIVLTRDGRPAKDSQADLAYVKFGAKWIWRWEAKSGAEPDETMTHELGHLWLTFWADGMEPPKVKRYGSSLPDWFDEGIASLLEGPRAHAAYDADLKRRILAGESLPLSEVLDHLHPDSREESKREKSRDRWIFYAQTYSLVAFLAEKYTSEAFRHVAATLKAGKNLGDALGAKNLPFDLATLEKAWRAWAAAR